MKISARNQLSGSVTALKTGSVNSEVEIAIADGVKIVAIVTNESVSTLGLSTGKSVTALIKASSILVMTNAEKSVLSARNVLTGKVSKVNNGPISAEVAIALPSGVAIHATITHDAVQELSIKEGDTVGAVFKASSVILAVNA